VSDLAMVEAGGFAWSLKPCPHWRLQVADFGDKLSPKSATMVSSVDRL